MLSHRRFLLSLVAALVILPSSLLAQCGVERESVKTGTDPDASKVNLNSSTNTTITAMRAFAAPSPIPANNRVSPAETTVWVINATLTVFKLESDSDYHLVIQDASGNTMITEIPSPSCVGSTSPFASAIQNARAKFDAKFSVTTSFQTANIPVQIVGVGMFDFLHGQTGVAPNGIELHPVLDIIFNPGTQTPDFTLSASPSSLSVTQGGSVSTTVSSAVTGGFNSAVSLSVTGLPSGVTASFSPASLAAPGSGNSTLTFSTTTAAAAGTFNATVNASGGGVTHSTTVAVTINAAAKPDFTVSASPSSLSIAQGNSAATTITTAATGGFNAALSLSVSGLPAGLTASFSPTSIAAPGNGNSRLTFTASSTATTGTFNITVTASGGGVTHTATVPVTVASTQTPDFILSASPTSLSIAQGSSGTTSISSATVGGFNSAVSLSVSGLPAGVTASFNPTSIAAPGSGNSTLTFSAAGTATTGTFNATVSATGGGVTHTTSVSVAVTAAGGGGGNTTTQLLGNPGFENGSANPSPWTVTTTASTNRVINSTNTEPPHSGTFDAWLDGHGTTTTDSILQQVAIPSNATAASLSFFLHIDTAETSTTKAFDTLAVQVRNTSGTVLSTLKTFSNLNAASGYQQQSFDLSSFKGQTIQVFLQGKEDFELQTSFVVDDFTLNVTTPGSTTDTTPPTTSVNAPINGATVSGTVNVSATASDNVGVTQMQLLIDGTIVTSNTNATSLSFSLDTTSVANGSHTIVSKAFDAAGNVGTSSTVTVTVSNAATGGTPTELIGNGGFENGASSPAPWTVTTTSSQNLIINSNTAEPPHSGTFDAWLDGNGTTTTDTITQQVAIPSTITTATLSFWLHIDTAETSTTTAFDKMTVKVLDSAGNVLSTLATFSNLNAASGYQQHTFDLSSFKGQTVQICMQGVEDFELQTSFVVDDVSLQVQ